MSSTTDFDHARSGILVGVVIGGGAAALFGVLFSACALDLLGAVLSARRVPFTSLLVGGFGALGAGVFGLMARSSFRTLTRWQRLHDRFVFASATLGAIRRTGHRINRRLLFEIPLRVAPADRPPYDTVTRWFVPSDVRDRALPGVQVVVRVDPDDPKVVLVDWDRTREAHGLPPPPR